MAECFAVPTKCDSEKRTKLLSHLKCLMTSLEDELTPKAEPVCYTPVCLTTCIPCCPPPCKPPTATTPDILVCYKCKTDSSKKKKNKANVGKELGESKSRELRAGILYVGCDCERKNGLQDNCLRTGCQGSPECLKSPPTCLPSKYCNGKHLMKKLRNKYAKNESEGSGEEEEGPDSISYQCFEAAVKVPDQKICVLMPSLGCPPDCKQDKKAC
ncbi:uncharacterized protein LOC123679610 [Harmonia axyridis]|uniref:uncharacterized protein LOC123679610 n=1 Tax=Harmonia axyridis TaxID=115357 RepID=UPI001E277768|nr:uncharacterized protein LOC123679610 [Harmonia axyridis]